MLCVIARAYGCQSPRTGFSGSLLDLAGFLPLHFLDFNYTGTIASSCMLKAILWVTSAAASHFMLWQMWYGNILRALLMKRFKLRSRPTSF